VNELQAMFDGMSAQWQRERAKTQMTLGKMIECIESMPADSEISGLCEPHSYRGYYSDLSFEVKTEKVKASELLEICKQAMGNVFQGYKGGNYVMGSLTPVWIADYGCCGMKLMAINQDGSIEVEDES
jgi:hypothetical protein